MSGLLEELMKRADANARAELEVYESELPEYRIRAENPRGRAEMLDYAVWFRRHTVELVRESRPLSDEDLAYIGDIGRKRAEEGLSTGAAQHVLALHATLMLREINEVAAGDDLAELLRLTAWFGEQGARGSGRYLDGYLAAQRLRLSVGKRLHDLVELLLAGDLSAASLAHDLGVCLHDHYVAVVLRFPGRPPGRDDDTDELVESVFKMHAVPIAWRRPDELLALLPACAPRETPSDDALPVVRDIADAVAGPCRVGAATGPAARLPETVSMARRVAEVAPVQRIPRVVPGIGDVFVELGVVRVPEVDQWLRDVARRLANGPDLVTTLDVYYRSDMNRLRAAVALHVHPRTLDYRLRRVREVTGFDPGSTKGIRVLTAAVARLLAGAWA
ncbi:helix-turn-helix domain-containing protein [Amycolatopsis sp. A133]|uniref:PucR family transcriptional regulator n=1 Tax=Amycolatopsis sp. A133 TaxID=3064472 RepID=UPI0027E69631|nr:helix-turn-helix domain-containing protein [Amycolatopsis sp. A133]MDQ7808661.1 helix-turn-helix domain-containing protein [Amycolatopsis sp. A133]